MEPPSTTLWKRYNGQISDLILELEGNPEQPCSVNFIRCIKPNNNSVPDNFVDSIVLQQLNCIGVLDAINIRKSNYPYRMKYDKFYEQYEDLCSVSIETPLRVLKEQNPKYLELTKQVIKEQLGELGKDLYAFGKSLILFKNEIRIVLEKGKKKARCEKELAANYIIEAFDSIQGIIKYNERTNKIDRKSVV